MTDTARNPRGRAQTPASLFLYGRTLPLTIPLSKAILLPQAPDSFRMAEAMCPFPSEALWQEAWRIRQAHHPDEILFTRPTATVPVSLTGASCALNCAHCGGHYLQHMRFIEDLTPSSETSYLISGGCDALGRVPITTHLEAIRRLRPGHRMNWHVGLSSETDLRAVLPYVDVISFDIVGDRETAHEVYGLDLNLEDYLRTFEALRRLAPVVPHLTIGLRGGRLSGEWAVLEALQALGVEHLILIILIPTPGTRYAGCAPPSLEDVSSVFLAARRLLPQARLSLGCMRPMGAYRQEVDALAIRAGLNALVNPTRRAEALAQEYGLRILWRDECCALI